MLNWLIETMIIGSDGINGRDSADWINRGYIPDPGVNTIEVLRLGEDTWIMSQSISNERSGYWPLRRNLRLKCMIWDGGFGLGTSNVRFDCVTTGHSISPTAVEIPE